MAGQGAGPSRRSHTKSRTGCKTCKRRHIRCDESFPQCRNCTKHQVRCDYMESVPAEGEHRAPEQASVPSNPGTEQNINMWLQTGYFPYPELQVFPSPQPQAFNRSDLQLITHLSSISRNLLVNGTSELTVWSPRVPQYLSIASSYPFVMHAFLAFSASHLAWVSPASDARKLQIQHGGIALRGLHDSISSFSKSNADSVLAASILLMAQANDWRTWSSLEAGIKSVSSAMESWKHESMFADFLGILPSMHVKEPQRPLPSHQERQTVLTGTMTALQRLQPFLSGHEIESQWVGQLLGYIRTLLSSPAGQTPAEQFDQLYRLRKWTLFVPSLLLDDAVVDGPAILVLAHLYATALAIEPLFPSLGPGFCAAISLGPLEKIIQMTAPMQVEQHSGHSALEIGSLMHFPQQAAATYRSRAAWVQQQHLEYQRVYGPVRQNSFPDSVHMDFENLAHTSLSSMSPGFAPSTIHSYQSSLSSGSRSPYLEVPTPSSSYDGSSYVYAAQEWAATPSPAFPPQPYMGHEDEHGYDSGIGTHYGSYTGGFVNAPIWT